MFQLHSRIFTQVSQIRRTGISIQTHLTSTTAPMKRYMASSSTLFPRQTVFLWCAICHRTFCQDLWTWPRQVLCFAKKKSLVPPFADVECRFLLIVLVGPPNLCDLRQEFLSIFTWPKFVTCPGDLTVYTSSLFIYIIDLYVSCVAAVWFNLRWCSEEHWTVWSDDRYRTRRLSRHTFKRMSVNTGLQGHGPDLLALPHTANVQVI